MSRDYLTTADVLGLHAILLERYGGASGIRDMGALESTVYRPQCGYYADTLPPAHGESGASDGTGQFIFFRLHRGKAHP